MDVAGGRGADGAVADPAACFEASGGKAPVCKAGGLGAGVGVKGVRWREDGCGVVGAGGC